MRPTSAPPLSFHDTTLTFTVGSKTVQVDGPWSQDTSDLRSAPVYLDSELWVYGDGLFHAAWNIDMTAIMDRENPQRKEDGSGVFTFWLVNP